MDDEGGIQRQGRAAYDLPGLLIGSEGTLGLVTGARLRLLPLPRHRAALLAHFPGVEPLAEAVSEAVASGAVPARMEFMDPACAGAVEDYLRMGLPRGRALLLVETDGEEADLVEEELSLVEASARRHGAEVVRAAGEAEAEALWRARRAVSPALGRIRPKRVNEDIAVPRSALPRVVREIEALGKAFGLVVVQFGHIGDGNLHPNILFDPRRESEEKVWELAHEIARVALRHGGALRGARHRPHEAGLHAGGGGPRDPGGAPPGQGGAGPPGPLQPREGPSLSPVRFSRRFDGGEAIMGPWKASTASFMSSPGWAFLWALGFSSSGIRLGAGSGGSTFSSPSFWARPSPGAEAGPPLPRPRPGGLPPL